MFLKKEHAYVYISGGVDGVYYPLCTHAVIFFKDWFVLERESKRERMHMREQGKGHMEGENLN